MSKQTTRQTTRQTTSTTDNNSESGRTDAQLQADTTAKLRRVSVSPMFTAILAHLVGARGWTTPGIAALCITSDGYLMAQAEGDIGFNAFIGSERDLAHNIQGVAGAAGLDAEEMAWLDGRVAAIRRW